MRRLKIETVLPVFLCVCIVVTPFAEAASLRQMQRLYKTKQYSEAKAMLSRELPGLTGRSRRRGLLLLATLETDAERAMELYRKVTSTGDSDESLMARLELAKIHYAQGEYRSAITALSRIPNRGSTEDRMAALYFRALCWKQLGESDNARSDLQAIDRGSFLYGAYAALAELDMQEGHIGDAIEKYETIAGGHSNPVAGFKLGECYEILGERRKALEVYRTVIQQFPESLEAPKAREKIQMIERRGQTSDAAVSGEADSDGEIDEGPSPGSTIATGYTLQFGAFTERENAIRLADDLRRSVNDVRLERVEREGGTMYRVRAGRFPNKGEAERAASRIQKETGYFSKPLPFE